MSLYTHDGASAKFVTNSLETDNNVMTLPFLKIACHFFLSNMHLFPRKNWNPTTAEEESDKKGNNQVRSRSVTVRAYLPGKATVRMML